MSTGPASMQSMNHRPFSQRWQSFVFTSAETKAIKDKLWAGSRALNSWLRQVHSRGSRKITEISYAQEKKTAQKNIRSPESLQFCFHCELNGVDQGDRIALLFALTIGPSFRASIVLHMIDRGSRGIGGRIRKKATNILYMKTISPPPRAVFHCAFHAISIRASFFLPQLRRKLAAIRKRTSIKIASRQRTSCSSAVFCLFVQNGISTCRQVSVVLVLSSPDGIWGLKEPLDISFAHCNIRM